MVTLRDSLGGGQRRLSASGLQPWSLRGEEERAQESPVLPERLAWEGCQVSLCPGEDVREVAGWGSELIKENQGANLEQTRLSSLPPGRWKKNMEVIQL